MADGSSEWTSFLGSTEIFREVGGEALRDLARLVEIVDFAADETVFRQDELSDAMYLIASGQVSVLGKGAENEERLLAVLGPGRDVGELALWMGGRRSATVRTITPTRAARLKRDAFLEFTRRYPESVAGIDRHIARRQRQAQLGAALHVSGLLGGLEEDVLRDLENALETLWIEGGATLFRQGDAGDSLYIVVRGLMQVVLEESGAEPRVVAELGRGEIFGEMSLLADEPRSATLRAARDSVLARLPRADFERLLARHPHAILPMLTRQLVKRLREQNAGVRQPQRALVAFAVVSAGADVPLDEFCRRLADSLQTHGRTLVLSSASLDAWLEQPGAAQTAESQAGHGRILELLGKLEADHRFVIYQADPNPSAWTARGLRQCDRLLIAALAAADPQPREDEAALWRMLAHSPKRAALVLLHPDDSRRPTGTHQWLIPRKVERHYHVRMDRADDFDRLARSLAGRAVGLVLGGGAARGFAHAGIMRALREAGVPLDVVGGTSAGALFAATCALGYDYEHSIRVVADGMAAIMANLTFPVVSLITGHDGAVYLRAQIGDMQVEDLWLPYFCVSANLTRASVHVHKRGSLARAILATTRLPAILPPILWEGDLLVDGGVINNVPVDVLRGYEECGTVIASDVSPAYEPPQITPFGDSVSGWHALRQFAKPRAKRKVYPGMLSVLMRTMEFGGAAYKSQIIGAADLYLAPPVAQFKMNDFKRAAEVAEAGYHYAVEKVAEWRKK